LFNERAFSQYGKEKMRGKRYTKNENSGLNITLSSKIKIKALFFPNRGRTHIFSEIVLTGNNERLCPLIKIIDLSI